VFSNHNPNGWSDESDPFGEDFFAVTPEEETRARAKRVLQDNQDAIRHYVEVLSWELMDNPELRKVLITLLWHWEQVEPEWIAEASFMSVGDVSRLAESQTLLAFPCLYCGAELRAKGRDHRLQMHRSSEVVCRNSSADDHLAKLLCESCRNQRADYLEEQRQLDALRQEALLAEYRDRPYAERRRTREWTILKRQVHRRDKYRCRLCGDGDVELHVHHATYKHYAAERLEDLITLCSSCHNQFHFPAEAS